ncbi:MAG: A/G-specific adenine glycosylase [Gemmatimonadaceae bacterium]|nr:A/G-specific adenine glycosylase [Gloeobacterales cyanobacterium ES-bin-141]
MIADQARLRSDLLAWYARTGRDLPWRTTRDPYAIWVSEIMLQQTQVRTVLPYYKRWLAVLPTLKDLAAADEQVVLKLWEGLGYYTRARNLHRAARYLWTAHAGVFPHNFEQVVALPGVGRSTAGAILSSAFNLPCAILDANVRRVVSRLAAVDLPAERAGSALWQLSEQLLDPAYPRDFNQALMDLGATVCLPRRPLCPVCPWQEACLAHQSGQPERFSTRPRRPPRPHRYLVSVIIRSADTILLVRRPERGLLAGLWEFPGLEVDSEDQGLDALQTAFGPALQITGTLGRIQHEYSHLRVSAQVFNSSWQTAPETLSGPPGIREKAWVSPDAWSDYPMPQIAHKIARLYRECQQLT